MKRLLLSVLCLLCIGAVCAQKRVGQLSFIPRVGLNLSNLGDMDFPTVNFDVANDDSKKSKTRPDFMLGGDVEYQLKEPLAVSIGAYYSRQGCRWATFYDALGDDKEEGWEDMSMKLPYLNIPLTAHMYVNDYISFMAGVQCGVYLGGGTLEYTSNEIAVNTKTGERTYGTPQYHNEKMQGMNALVLSIPLGVAVEYERAIIDVRYNFPLTHFNKNISKGGNQVFTFSVGYRL